MMKKVSSSMLMLCLAAVLALFTPSLGQALKYCPAPPIPRTGACGSGGQQDCFFRVLAIYPASKMPKNIKCVDIGPSRSQCTADIVC